MKKPEKEEVIQPSRFEFVEREEEERGIFLRTFSTTYTLGDSNYDESFNIETEEGKYLGECGVSASEIIGSGDPEKVTAFEIWLFDKDDIRTVTKVIASDYAFRDESLRDKLTSRGEVILAHPGKIIFLETAGLKLEAQIKDMAYGNEEMPPQSYFTKFAMELRVISKVAPPEE